MRIIRIIAGVMVFVAIIFSFLSVFTLFNRLYIYFNRDQYRVESFEVAEALNQSHRKGFSSCWLTGTVADSVFSLEEYQQKVDNADSRLERSDESIRNII